MKFKTQFDEKKERIYTCSGSPIVIKYEPKYNKKGDFELVEVGSDNIYDQIQSYKDSTDIHVIISRFINGDESALNKVEGTYGDFSGYPDSFLDIVNMVDKERRLFEGLPVDVRNQFGNSFERYAAALSDPSFLESLADQQGAAPSIEQATAESAENDKKE